jgi:acid stress chaperone HdeB
MLESAFWGEPDMERWRQDMMKAKAILLGLMLCAITAVGHAQVTIDVAKITCNQFATYKIADPENIALWLSGYHNGKHGGNTLVDPQALKAKSNEVVNYCLHHPDTPVMQAVETLFGISK